MTEINLYKFSYTFLIVSSTFFAFSFLAHEESKEEKPHERVAFLMPAPFPGQ